MTSPSRMLLQSSFQVLRRIQKNRHLQTDEFTERVTEFPRGRGIGELDDALRIEREDCVRSTVHDGVVASVLPLAQDLFALDGDRDVDDLNEASEMRARSRAGARRYCGSAVRRIGSAAAGEAGAGNESGALRSLTSSASAIADLSPGGTAPGNTSSSRLPAAS